MAITTFSGPIKAGTIKNTSGTTLGTDVKNTGQVVMAQTFSTGDTLDSGASAANETTVIIPDIKYKHVYHCIVAKYEGKKYKKNKDDFISLLWKKFKIQCIVQNRPLYKYDLFKKHGFKNSNCPKSDVFFDNMISWPFYVWMSDKEFNYMIHSTISVLQELRGK